MILTGQAKKDFISFMCKTYPHIRWHEYNNMTDSMINALIIEWFDLVGIYTQIDLENIDGVFSSYIFYNKLIVSSEENSNSRQKAIIKAITKANEIYNTSN